MLFKVIGRSGEPMKAIEIFENEMKVRALFFSFFFFLFWNRKVIFLEQEKFIYFLDFLTVLFFLFMFLAFWYSARRVYL